MAASHQFGLRIVSWQIAPMETTVQINAIKIPDVDDAIADLDLLQCMPASHDARSGLAGRPAIASTSP
jgi:hypothetical protein